AHRRRDQGSARRQAAGARVGDRADNAARLGRAARRQAAPAPRYADWWAGAAAAVVTRSNCREIKGARWQGAGAFLRADDKVRHALSVPALSRIMPWTGVDGQGGATMFGFGKKTPPPLCKSNPGICVEGKVAFARGDRSWTEEFNTVTLAASALQAHGFAVRTEKTWLVHEDSGFILLPQLVQLQPLDDGGMQAVTTMQTNHPDLAPDGLFEYQHSTADSTADAIRKG